MDLCCMNKIKHIGFFLCINIIPLSAYDYDLIIIGSGAAGMTASYVAQGYKKRILIIEKNKLGGGFIWSADIPSKALISIANRFYDFKSIQALSCTQEQKILSDRKAVLQYINALSERIYEEACSPVFFKDSKIDRLFGLAHFIDNHSISVNDVIVTGEKIIIATGSSAIIPPIKNLESISFLTPDNLFEQDELPESIIIIGAGPLGVEMAFALNRLGVKVTLIMRYGLVLPTFDFELVDYVMDLMQEEGIHLECGMEAIAVKEENNETILTCLDYAGRSYTFSAQKVFIALNRRPNISDLGLENTDIIYSESNGIHVDATMQTSVPTIYACGDVVGNLGVFGRIAYYQAKIAVKNLFCSPFQSYTYAHYVDIPKVIYTTFPLASVGMTEQEARKVYGTSIRIYTLDYTKLIRAHIEDKTIGLAKFITDQEGILIGAHIFGESAGLIIDNIKLNKRLDMQFENHFCEIHSTPSYYDLLYLVSDMCRQDSQKQSFMSSVGNFFKRFLP